MSRPALKSQGAKAPAAADQLNLRLLAVVHDATPAASPSAAAIEGRIGSKIFLYCDEKDFARAAGAVLAQIYGDDIGRLAADGGCDERTARGWLKRAHGPRGLHLCRLVVANAPTHPDLIRAIERQVEADPAFDRATGEFTAATREAHS